MIAAAAMSSRTSDAEVFSCFVKHNSAAATEPSNILSITASKPYSGRRFIDPLGVVVPEQDYLFWTSTHSPRPSVEAISHAMAYMKMTIVAGRCYFMAHSGDAAMVLAENLWHVPLEEHLRSQPLKPTLTRPPSMVLTDTFTGATPAQKSDLQHVWLGEKSIEELPIFLVGTSEKTSAAKFHSLATEWRSATAMFSFPHQWEQHPAYKEILRMGEDVVPLILQELKDHPHHWFGALEALTGENPIKPEDEGYFQKMADAWLDWGVKNGHISRP